MSDDEDEDEVVFVAHAAIATSSYSPATLFESPNENAPTTYTCLMAKASSVTSSTSKSIASTSPSLLDCVEKVEPNKLDLWLAKLKGESKINVDALIEQLDEANALVEEKEEIIMTLEGHSRDYANEIGELANALEKEQSRRAFLEKALYNLE